MGIQQSAIALLVVLILAAAHLSNGRQIPRLAREETHRTSAEFDSRFSNYFSAAAAAAAPAGSGNGDKADVPVYEASYRTVPTGPNPLHN
ncbi:hypothetical protein RHSIM_Rhsim07G0092200 [Rhododendron simsii]|uniref:Uncharacterized protein n=1 Tax=Rhododendron simsii TaxID=118357 RepID=A0A834GRI1_RHOSS|nr:hypothetical protein RHSIM_Rhsim07G0092200 [Rhododendron simsii]